MPLAVAIALYGGIFLGYWIGDAAKDKTPKVATAVIYEGLYEPQFKCLKDPDLTYLANENWIKNGHSSTVNTSLITKSSPKARVSSKKTQ